MYFTTDPLGSFEILTSSYSPHPIILNHFWLVLIILITFDYFQLLSKISDSFELFLNTFDSFWLFPSKSVPLKMWKAPDRYNEKIRLVIVSLNRAPLEFPKLSCAKPYNLLTPIIFLKNNLQVHRKNVYSLPPKKVLL